VRNAVRCLTMTQHQNCCDHSIRAVLSLAEGVEGGRRWQIRAHAALHVFKSGQGRLQFHYFSELIGISPPPSQPLFFLPSPSPPPFFPGGNVKEIVARRERGNFLLFVSGLCVCVGGGGVEADGRSRFGVIFRPPEDSQTTAAISRLLRSCLCLLTVSAVFANFTVPWQTEIRLCGGHRC
jgi:hypothetical protein